MSRSDRYLIVRDFENQVVRILDQVALDGKNTASNKEVFALLNKAAEDIQKAKEETLTRFHLHKELYK